MMEITNAMALRLLASQLGRQQLSVASASSGVNSRFSRFMSSKKVEVNNVLLNCDIVGNGSHPVLLIPGGLGCSQTDLKYQMEHLDHSKFTLVAMDPRGYGKSIPPSRDWPDQFFQRDADDAAELMKNLGIMKYSILGWSDGGNSAMIVAAKHPENVEKLVVWGSNSYITREDMKIYAKIRDFDSWSEKMRNHMLEVYDAEYLRLQCNLWVDALTTYFDKFYGNICRGELASIRCPTLVMHGEKDAMVPRFHAEYLVAHIAGAKFKSFPEGKHNIHQRYYEEFNSTVEEFLTSPPLKSAL